MLGGVGGEDLVQVQLSRRAELGVPVGPRTLQPSDANVLSDRARL